MRRKKNDNHFIRFLKDEKFIEWKLFPTDELEDYWEKYLQQYPDERDNMLLAENYFSRINLSSFGMPKGRKSEAIKRLKQSLSRYSRKRKIHRFLYTAAACGTILLSMYIWQNANRSDSELKPSSDSIVGNELESEDILFITGTQTISFQENINIQISENNIAQVKTENKVDKEVAITQNEINKVIVPYGKRSRVTLVDGTQVWLNSGSSFEFPTVFNGKMREVQLSGEMYIEVAPDRNKPFQVHTSDFNIKVYGTRFNVSSYTDSPSSVVLVEGSIGLQSSGKQELLLSPDEQAIYSDATGSFNTRKVDVHTFISWKEGYLTFEDTPIIEVLKQIERYYNLSFNYGDDVSFQGITCAGKIILSDNLDNVMTALTSISSTHYKKEDKLIHIYKK